MIKFYFLLNLLFVDTCFTFLCVIIAVKLCVRLINESVLCLRLSLWRPLWAAGTTRWRIIVVLLCCVINMEPAPPHPGVSCLCGQQIINSLLCHSHTCVVPKSPEPRLVEVRIGGGRERAAPSVNQLGFRELMYRIWTVEGWIYKEVTTVKTYIHCILLRSRGVDNSWGDRRTLLGPLLAISPPCWA